MTPPTSAASLKIADILLIEDNQDHQDLICEALQGIGIANPLHTARTAGEARCYLQEGIRSAAQDGSALPCLILLDLRLPDASGLELLAEIKKDPALRTIPVAVLTTCEDPDEVHCAYQSGANGYLVKPIRAGEFTRMVSDSGLYWVLSNRPSQT